MKEKGSYAVLKIYLDLEANAITNEAISIGMVSETGKEFYSLIRPHTKLDHKIKLLTHISQEEAEQAPELEEVVLNVMKYLASFNKDIQILTYGKDDASYLRASSSFTNYESVRNALVAIADGCQNVAKKIAKHFRRKAINLRSAYLTMRMDTNEPLIQNHNALEDAYMLKWIWENIDDYILPQDVSPIKIEKIDMRYGKKSSNSQKNNPKYKVAVKACYTSKKNGYREQIFPSVMAASSLICGASNLHKRLAAMDRVLEACETGNSVNGRYFVFVESKENS